MKQKRTFKTLCKESHRVYVYLSDSKEGNLFLQQAEAEGFTFADGAKPTQRPYAQVMAVNSNKTINYVGANGMIAFGAHVDKFDKKKLIRVDFRK